MNCISCGRRKQRDDVFYLLHSLTPTRPFDLVLYLRKHRKNTAYLGPICEEMIPPKCKICRECYYYGKKWIRVQKEEEEESSEPPDQPDLSFFRLGNNSHNYCTFGCSRFGVNKRKNNTENDCLLVSVSERYRHELLMQYKCYLQRNARMCSKHLGTINWWPLVKQIKKAVKPEQLQDIMELQHKFYNDRFQKAIQKDNTMNEEVCHQEVPVDQENPVLQHLSQWS